MKDQPIVKIVTVLGARPQFVKASAVSRAILSDRRMREIVIHTGQHFDANMSTVFFDELGMDPPNYSLGIHGGGHGEMTGRMLIALEHALTSENPSAVLVYGDTNSTLAGAVAAAKMGIPVAHVEAGLRSFNMAMPEEVNRVLTDRISTWLFAPTLAAVRHLEREGASVDQIAQVGDVMYDVALHHRKRSAASEPAWNRHRLAAGSYVLATIHRAENTDHSARLSVIVAALERVAASYTVVWPLHPRTREVLQRSGWISRLLPNVRLIDPVGYLEMVELERHAAVIATDSGGVQKEAYFHRVPCVTLREETEWVELIEAGWNCLAPPFSSDAVAAAILDSIGRRGADGNPYGDGDAAVQIVRRLASDLDA